MKTIALGYSIKYRLFIALTAVLFLALTVFVAMRQPLGPQHAIFLLLAVAWLFAIRRALIGGPTVFAATEAGLSGSRLGGRVIPWAAIKGAWSRRHFGEPYLCLRLEPPESYLDMGQKDRLRFAFKRRERFGDVSVHFLGLALSAEEAAKIISSNMLCVAAA